MTGRRSGFTLVETLVAGGLFVVLGLIAYTIFKYAMIAHNRGLIGTDAQHNVRELINRMASDLQSGMVLQVPLGRTDTVPSAVLHPSSERLSTTDDVIFTAPAVQNLGTLNASNPANYLLVRYAVHNHDRTKPNDPPTAVLRRTYRYDEVQNYLGFGAETGVTGASTGSWYFIDRAGMDTALGGPGDNSKLGTASNDTPWQEIITLGGEYDMVTFTVSHRRPVAGQPCDPFGFSISATVERYVGTPSFPMTTMDINNVNDKKNDRVVKDLSTDVTLQRFQ